MRAALLLLSLCAWAAQAAEDEDAEDSNGHGILLGEHLPLRLDARFGLMVRHDSGYYHDARVFAEVPRVSTNTSVAEGDAIPPGGGGIISAGAVLLPRTTLALSFAQYTNGVSEGETKLSLTSQRWGADLKFAPVLVSRGKDVWDSWSFRLELSAGAGYYLMHEDYLDRAVFDTTLHHTTRSFGGRFGAEATIFIGALGFVVAYAYHLAPATISDRIGGSIDAGGQEISFGLVLRAGRW